MNVANRFDFDYQDSVLNSSKSLQEKMSSFGISIVICTHNGSSRLKSVVDSILAQDVPAGFPWEIIVVDNASSDDSSKVAGELLASQDLVSHRIVSETKLGLVFARMKGIEESSYEIVAFVDDDNWIQPGWLQEAYSIMASHGNVGVCGGLNDAALESEAPDWFSRFESSFSTGPQGERRDITWKKGYVFGAGMIVRKTAWNQAAKVFSGIFPQCIGRQGNSLSLGDDNEICYALRALGWHIRYDPRLKLRHYLPAERLSESYLFEVQKRYGRATVLLDGYLLAGDSKFPFLSTFRRSWIWQFFLTLSKLVLFMFSFASFKLFPWSSQARLEAHLRIVRHSSRLRELLRYRKRYTENIHEVQERLKGIRIKKADYAL